MDNYEGIRFGIITALDEEFIAMKVLLNDEKVEDVDGVRYCFGTIPSFDGKTHKVALCLLPGMGNNASAIFASKMSASLKKIDSIIMCGIAGGVPAVVHLGDVVVSTKGIIKYDYGKNEAYKFIQRDEIKPCDAYLTSAVKYMRASELEHGRQWDKHLDEINRTTSEDFSRPTKDERYFEYCDGDYNVVTRANSKLPVIYYEKIASADVVQKDPTKRDVLPR